MFYDNYTRICSKDDDTLIIGQSLTIAFKPSNIGCKIDFKAANTLKTRAKDLKFIIALFETEELRIGDSILLFKPVKEEAQSFDLQTEKSRLEYYEQMIQVLDILNVKDDLDLSQMTDEDFRNFKRLLTAFLGKKPVSGLKSELPMIGNLKIANLNLMLTFVPCREEVGKYHIYDFFRTSVPIVGEYTDGVMYPVSQYAILGIEEFLTVSNIRYEVLLPSFKDMKEKAFLYERANSTLIYMLLAYDKCEFKRNELLVTAKDFAEWLLANANDEVLDKPIRQLNLLQVIKRERDFQIEEIKILYEIVENNPSKDDILLGAYLLLDNHAAAALHLNKLEHNIQKIFAEYPIYKFYKE